MNRFNVVQSHFMAHAKVGDVLKMSVISSWILHSLKYSKMIMLVLFSFRE